MPTLQERAHRKVLDQTTSDAGLYSATPGAVASVDIPHNLGVVPTAVVITPANANFAALAAGAAGCYVSAMDNAKITVTASFAGATAYQFYWAVSA